MRTTIERGRFGAFLVVLTVAAVACTSTGRILPPPEEYVEPVPEAGGEPTTGNPIPDSLGGPYAHGRRGVDNNVETPEAPAGLSTGAVSEADLVNYLNRLNFDKARDNSELALIACKPPAAAHCGITLYIQPEVGMRHRRYTAVPPYGIPPNGMVVARIINYSPSDSDITYGILPQRRAYWLVYPGAPGALPRSRVFIRTPGAVAAMKFLRPDTTYEKCRHSNEGGPAVAKFRKCVAYKVARAGGDHVEGGSSNPFVRALSLVPTRHKLDAEPLTSTELWVKCAQGCCVAGTAQ